MNARPWPIPARRIIPVVPAMIALLVCLAGCGGGASEHPPAAEPAPSAAQPTGSPSGTIAPSADPSQATGRLSTGYLYRFDMISPANDNFAITTREVYLYFRPDTTAVHFQLENRLGIAERILWDECTFFDTDGRTFRAVHRGVTYANRNLPQEPTWVQPNQRLVDFLVPVDVLQDPGAAEGGGMRKLLPTDLSANGLLGKTFGCTLVIEVGTERLEFPARFKIASVHPGP